MRLGYYSSVRWLTENDGVFSINPEEEKKGGGEGQGEGKKKHAWDWNTSWTSYILTPNRLFCDKKETLESE